METFDNDRNDVLDTNTSSHRIVKNTIQDLFEIQQSTLDQVRLKAEKQKSSYVLKTEFNEIVDMLDHEKLEHTKTKCILDEMKENFEFISNENEILREQMKKQKEEFENTTKSLQNKTSRETKRCDFLIAKCTDAEREMDKLQDLLQMKNSEIADLKKRIKTQKENHKHTLLEIDITKKQEDYLAKALSESQRKKA